MWPNSCVTTTKCVAYYTCLTPTSCRPMFSFCCPSLPNDDRSHMRGIVSWGQEVGEKGPRSDECWDTVMKATDHTSEILIRTLGRAEAVTLTALLGLPSTLQAKLHFHTHIQFTPPRNHYPSVETDTAITWKARKTPLQRAFASLPVKAMRALCVCVQSCTYASTLETGNALALHDLGHRNAMGLHNSARSSCFSN